MNVTFARVVRAEWTKFVALRSTWILFALVAVATIGLSAAIAHNAVSPSSSAPFLGVDVVSLLLGVAGIVMMTGEYGSGLVRATFAAVPTRLPVLGAKAVVLTGLALPIMAVVVLLSAGVFRLVGGPLPGSGDHIVGAFVAPVLLALLGLGLGTLIRHTAAAITTYVLAILVVPALLGAALPDDLGDRLVKYTPVAAAQALYTDTAGDPSAMLSAAPAAVTLVVWVVAALAAGAVIMLRQDP
jgi:ABC-2 type transport system permease protein